MKQQSRWSGSWMFAIGSILLFAMWFARDQLFPSYSFLMVHRRQTNEGRVVLPDNVKPIHYDLMLKIDLETVTFEGKVDIAIDVLVDQTRFVTLNARDIELYDVSVSDNHGMIHPSNGVKMDVDLEQVSFCFENGLPEGRATFSVGFKGAISTGLSGLYQSRYDDGSGIQKIMAATQFEATDARRAFPCFDEPALKSTFSISLKVQSHLTALSNMNVENEIMVENGWKTLVFAKSPIMSTYLVAFVVGELDYIEAENDGGVKVRVYAPSGTSEQGRFALEVACGTLDFFTEYFEQAYPLPKMDMVAVPDFGAGAMENWGLVTYRTTLLLFEKSSSSLDTKKNIAYVVGHELAHQWFGNLVTMEWWSDLWLNEGFATWAGWLVADHLFPEWDVWVEFVAHDFQAGLSLDSLRSSHPIEVPVRNPAEIGEISDSISYSKGASLIRMLDRYLTGPVFRKCLCHYLKRHAYGNARTIDLWHSLAEVSGKPVEKMMEGWTKAMGYPVLTVTRLEGSRVRVTQNRFLSSGDVSAEDDGAIWQVPLLTVGRKDEGETNVMSTIDISENGGDVLDSRTSEFDLVGNFKLNGGQCGFYRVSYEKEHLHKLGETVLAGLMGVEDRLGLLNDVFSLSFSGVFSTVRGLELLEKYVGETDVTVWSEIGAQLGKLGSVLFEADSDVIAGINVIRGRLFGPLVEKMGWEYEENDPKASLLRTLALGQAGEAGVEIVVDEAHRRFWQFVDGDSSKLHPDVRGTVFLMVVKHGGEREYEAVLQIYKTSRVADEKVRALSALAMTRVPSLLSRTLALALDSKEVRTQDVIYIFRSIATNPAGRRVAWTFIKDNWDELHEKLYHNSVFLLRSVVFAGASHLTCDSDVEDVARFFDARSGVDAIRMCIRQCAEKIKNASLWLKRDGETVSSYLVGCK